MLSCDVILKVIKQFLKNMRWTHCEQYDMWRSCIHFHHFWWLKFLFCYSFYDQKLFLHLKKRLDHVSVPDACYMKWCLSTSCTSYVTKASRHERHMITMLFICMFCFHVFYTMLHKSTSMDFALSCQTIITIHGVSNHLSVSSKFHTILHK